MPFKYLAQSFGYTLCVYLFENVSTCIYFFYVYIYMYMYIIISLKANVLRTNLGAIYESTLTLSGE